MTEITYWKRRCVWGADGLISFYLFIYLFVCLFMAALGLRCCVRGLSSCGEQGPLSAAVHGPLTAVASPFAEHGLQACGLQ